mmetsp:Transcript_16067/g.51264  ORF Transcript_16067/g.51264 Transcript_16067/m.51264 type:complete len:438 (-) Transcript_16067:124-1437(-)
MALLLATTTAWPPPKRSAGHSHMAAAPAPLWCQRVWDTCARLIMDHDTHEVADRADGTSRLLRQHTNSAKGESEGGSGAEPSMVGQRGQRRSRDLIQPRLFGKWRRHCREGGASLCGRSRRRLGESPDLDHSVVAGRRHHERVNRVEAHTVYIRVVRGRHRRFHRPLAVVVGRHGVDDDLVVPAARREAVPIGAPVDREDGALMAPLEHGPGHVLAPTVARPEANRAVLAAGGKAAAARLDGEAPHSVLVALQEVLARPVVHLLGPDAYRVVVRGRKEEELVRVPLYELYVLRVAGEHRNALELELLGRKDRGRGGGGRRLPDPNALVARAGGEEGAIVAPGHALDLVLVALERADALPLLGRGTLLAAAALPDDRGGVEAGRGEVAPARRELTGADGARLHVLEGGDARPGVRGRVTAPDPDHLVRAAAGQQRAAR